MSPGPNKACLNYLPIWSKIYALLDVSKLSVAFPHPLFWAQALVAFLSSVTGLKRDSNWQNYTNDVWSGCYRSGLDWSGFVWSTKTDYKLDKLDRYHLQPLLWSINLVSTAKFTTMDNLVYKVSGNQSGINDNNEICNVDQHQQLYITDQRG